MWLLDRTHWRGAARAEAHAEAGDRADREGQGLLPEGPDPAGILGLTVHTIAPPLQRESPLRSVIVISSQLLLVEDIPPSPSLTTYPCSYTLFL